MILAEASNRTSTGAMYFAQFFYAKAPPKCCRHHETKNLHCGTGDTQSAERVHVTGDELDKVGLALGAGFRKDTLQVRLDRRLGNAEDGRHLGHAADLDDHHQHSHFRWRE